MLNKFITILFTSFSLSAFSQITVTDSEIVDVDDIIYIGYDNNPSLSIMVGNSGLNQVWDFSSLQASNVEVESYISPIGTQYAGLYPEANLCLNVSGSLSYFDKSSDGIFVLGVSDTLFNSPALFLPLPLTYGMSITDGPIVVIDELITGTFLDLALPSSIVSLLTNNLANRADTALVKVTNTSEFLVDASGSLTTPLGTYDVLRLKEIKSIASVLNIYCTDTITQLGMWFNDIPFSAIPMLSGLSNDQQEITYKWITNDTSVSYLLASTSVDSFNVVKQASFQTDPIINSISQINCNLFNVYPNPISNNLIIEAYNHDIASLYVVDINGRLIFNKQFINNTNLDFSEIAKGVYYLNLSTSKVNLTKKIVVE